MSVCVLKIYAKALDKLFQNFHAMKRDGASKAQSMNYSVPCEMASRSKLQLFQELVTKFTHNYCTVWQHPSTVDVISTEIRSALTETLDKKYEPVILTFLISISAETISCARRLFDARLSAM